MYWDEMMDTTYDQTRDPFVPGPNDAAKQHVSKILTQIFDPTNKPMRFYLDVRQVEALERFEPPGEFPPLVWSPLFVEFNGRLKYDYDPTLSVLDSFDEVSYRAIYVCAATRELMIQQPDVPAFRGNMVYDAYWFQPTENFKAHLRDKFFCPSMVVQLIEQIWPRSVYDADVPSTERQYLDKLIRVTRNLLWFLAAENQVWVKITPAVRELHQKDLRGLPKSKDDYYVIPYQLPRYRYLVQKSSGNGARPGHRFDVVGHLRHLVHPRFHRDVNGVPRVVWVTGHQRGLDNEIYVPALRTGIIDRRVLEYDQFFKEKESRDRARPPAV